MTSNRITARPDLTPRNDNAPGQGGEVGKAESVQQAEFCFGAIASVKAIPAVGIPGEMKGGAQ